MNKKVKASLNKAKDVETKQSSQPAPPAIPVVPPRTKSYVLPGQLRQMAVQALLTGSPKQLSVGEVNQICNALNQLREVK